MIRQTKTLWIAYSLRIQRLSKPMFFCLSGKENSGFNFFVFLFKLFYGLMCDRLFLMHVQQHRRVQIMDCSLTVFNALAIGNKLTVSMY